MLIVSLYTVCFPTLEHKLFQGRDLVCLLSTQVHIWYIPSHLLEGALNGCLAPCPKKTNLGGTDFIGGGPVVPILLLLEGLSSVWAESSLGLHPGVVSCHVRWLFS